MKKPILYFDMDNVLVDFQSGIDATPPEVLAKYADDGKGKPHYDDIPGIFQRMKPVEGATQAVKTLSELFDCYILSTSPWNNPTALNDKLEWVKKHFCDVFYKRVIFTHHRTSASSQTHGSSMTAKHMVLRSLANATSISSPSVFPTGPVSSTT